MPRLFILIAAVLAALAVSPVVSSAATNALRGQPQMYRISAQTVQVKFTTDKRIARNGVRVAVSDRGATRRVTLKGRHGNDFNYVARVKVDRPLEVGRKYTVRFTFGDDRPLTRKVLVRATS